MSKKEVFVGIKCPECGNQFQSSLFTNDPTIETRTWGADCPNCNKAFNFKVRKKN